MFMSNITSLFLYLLSSSASQFNGLKQIFVVFSLSTQSKHGFLIVNCSNYWTREDLLSLDSWQPLGLLSIQAS